MAQIINLRTVRKQKARADKATQAEHNRALFGRTKAERLKQSAERAQADKHLDGHRKDDKDQ